MGSVEKPEAQQGGGAQQEKVREAGPAPSRRRPAIRGRDIGRYFLWLFVIFLVCSVVPGPDWRLDLKNKAALGYPRLLGIWSPAAIFTFFIVGIPATFIGVALTYRRAGGFAVLGILLWLVGMFGALAYHTFIPPHHRTQSFGEIRMLPYLGLYEFPSGYGIVVPDTATFHRHASHVIITSEFSDNYPGDLVHQETILFDENDLKNDTIFTATRQTNEWGFAAEFGMFPTDKDDFTTPTDPPIADILFLGDSFTFGYNIPAEQIWPALLLESLDEKGAWDESTTPTESVLKRGALAAAGGVTPREGLKWIKNVNREVKPKLIIAMYFEGNDLEDSERITKYWDRGHPVTTPYQLAMNRLPPGWVETNTWHAKLAHWFKPTDLRQSNFLRPRPLWNFEYDPRWETLGRDPVMGYEQSALYFIIPKNREPIEPFNLEIEGEQFATGFGPNEVDKLVQDTAVWVPNHPGWDEMENGLKLLAKLRHNSESDILIVVAPTKLSVLHPFVTDFEARQSDLNFFTQDVVDSEVRSEAREKGWHELIGRSEGTFAEIIADTCRRYRMPFLDLREPLREAAVELRDPLYFKYDSHWNLKGQEIVAQTISEYLCEQGIWPSQGY